MLEPIGGQKGADKKRVRGRWGPEGTADRGPRRRPVGGPRGGQEEAEGPRAEELIFSIKLHKLHYQFDTHLNDATMSY